MAPMKVLKGLPEGWSSEQCATCKMVFAFPPLDEGSGINVGMLTEELDRHVQQHRIDLPSAWKAEESFNNVSIRRCNSR
jgi:hypothetical protein